MQTKEKQGTKKFIQIGDKMYVRRVTEYTCINCSETFESVVKNPPSLYCSKECYRKHKRNKIHALMVGRSEKGRIYG